MIAFLKLLFRRKPPPEVKAKRVLTKDEARNVVEWTIYHQGHLFYRLPSPKWAASVARKMVGRTVPDAVNYLDARLKPFYRRGRA